MNKMQLKVLYNQIKVHEIRLMNKNTLAIKQRFREKKHKTSKRYKNK